MHPKRVSPKILRQQAQGGLPSGLRKQDERWMLTRLNKLYKLARKAGFNNPEQLELIGENVNFGGFFTHPILMPTSSQFRTALRDLKRQRRKFLHHKAKFVLASTNKDTIPLKEWFNDALAERDFMNSLDVFNVTPMYGKVRKLVKASAGSSFMDSLNGVTLTSISGKARKLAKASSGRKGDRMTEAFSVIIILLILALLMRQAARKPTIREERLIGPIIEEVQAAVCETQPLIQDLNQTYNITNFHQAENLTKLNVGNLSVEVKDCPGYKNFDNKIPTLSWNLPFKTSYTLEGSNLNFTHALDKNETLNTTSEVVKWLEFQQLVREYREAVKLQKNTYTYRKELKVVGGKMAHLISEERISRRNLPDLKELVNLSHGFSQNLTYLSRWFTIADSSSKAGYFNRTLLEIIEPNIGKVSMETRNFTSR